jgi:hypothetical protein
MKMTAIKLFAVVLLILAAANIEAQPLLLDSLVGTWTMSEQYRNKDRIDTKGTVEFLEDGEFRSNGSYFGTAEGLYRTDETKSTIHIEIDGMTSEWNASIKNSVLRMVKPKRKRSPRVELILMSENAEVNSGGK